MVPISNLFFLDDVYKGQSRQTPETLEDPDAALAGWLQALVERWYEHTPADTWATFPGHVAVLRYQYFPALAQTATLLVAHRSIPMAE